MDATQEARIDRASLKRINTLHPKIREDVKLGYIQCLDRGVHIIVTQAARTPAYQDCLYAQGRKPMATINAMRAKIGEPAIGAADAATIVTKATGAAMGSWHLFALAFDFALLINGTQVSWNEALDLDKDGMKDWQEVVAVFTALGFEWGGGQAFINAGIRDAPHFQKRFGLTLATARVKYKKLVNGFIVI